jgi:hypothetical protein
MSLVFPQELTYVNRRAVAKYRPLEWRKILPVEQVPAWAEVVEDRRERSFVEDPVNVTAKGPTEELPEPSFSVANGYIKVFSFGYSYSFTDEEIQKAQHLGIPLQQKKVDAVTMGAENFLEKLAADGLTVGGGVSMLGINTLTDTTAITAVTKTGGGTAWSATATSAEIVADLHALADGVENASLQTSKCDTILLRLPQYQVANIRMSSALERTPLEIFRAQRPGVRVLVWNKLTSGTAVAADSRDEDGMRMLMQGEFQWGTPLRLLTGWRVPGFLRGVGGLVCRNRTPICKMTGL